MHALLPLALLLLVSLVCAFFRWRMKTWAVLGAAAIFIGWMFGSGFAAFFFTALLFAAVVVFVLSPSLRMDYLTKPMLDTYQKLLPPLSESEEVALAAGTVGFEGELFSGMPRWQKLLDQPAPKLTEEERAFLDGPCEELCALANEWEITHELADLPEALWDKLREHRLFGMIIPKEYGGHGFSAFMHSQVLQRLSSVSTSLGSTVAVPNSLGPAELLLHYGTEEQKNHYLPRLATGEDIPCFALTSPTAGSDATSIPDFGVVCRGEWNGEEVLGVRLTFNKRYITLAPVATVVGLAFQMHDPDGLLGDKEDIGITLALLPRDTKGLNIGRRHFPLNTAFHNGPLSGKDVFVPMSQLIGGEAYAGQGWKMLVECLSVGRAISLPSMSTGSMKMGFVATGAYARIRKQFGISIGRFEGVEEALAAIGGYTYTVNALTRATAAAVDRGEKPSVPSAIAKYHTTEIARKVVSHAMDVHGGKGIILGPNNYLGRMWQTSPISITVEGANILTRSMIIFGQGAIRCHPWVLKEMQAAAIEDEDERLKAFDHALWHHVGFSCSNAVRSFWMGLTGAQFGNVPGDDYTRRFYRRLNRYSAALAICADVSMLLLGGKLKFKEKLSARLGDVLSQLYISASILKRYDDKGRLADERPLLAWALFQSSFEIERALSAALRNYPVKWVGWLLWVLVFPLGRRATAPSDRLGRSIAAMMTKPTEVRDRLCSESYLTPSEHNVVGKMVAWLPEIIAAEPIERKLMKAVKNGDVKGLTLEAQREAAVAQGVITQEEAEQLASAMEKTLQVIATDDFDSSDLAAGKVQQGHHTMPLS